MRKPSPAASIWLSPGGCMRPMCSVVAKLVTTLVERPASKALRVYVRISHAAGQVQIHGECSCGAGGRCEHVVATLLRALADQGHGYSSLSESAGNPRGAQRAGDKVVDAVVQRVQRRLCYLLFDDAPAGRKIFIKLVCIRGNDDGGCGEEKIYFPSWALRGTPPSFLTTQDMTLLAALDQLAYDNLAAAYVMDGGSAGELILSGRCYWRDVSQPPLRWGEPRPATPRWAIDDAGWQTFELTLSPPATSVYAQPALLSAR